MGKNGSNAVQHQDVPDPRMIRAALTRMFPPEDETGTWEECAAAAEVDRVTLWRWRNGPDWDRAVEMALKGLRPEMLVVAYRRLMRSAEDEKGPPGVAAAKELIDRAHGATPQKHRHGQDPDAKPTRLVIEGADKTAVMQYHEDRDARRANLDVDEVHPPLSDAETTDLSEPG